MGFLEHVVEGLGRKEKSLSSMYFYDDIGSRLFQEIMSMPEYYLTNSEFEILSLQATEIGKQLEFNEHFDIVEYGAGDGSKTIVFLEALKQQGFNFTYIPIDVSKQALEALEDKLKERDLGIKYRLYHGDYSTYQKTKYEPTLYLFLGANIGNYQGQGRRQLLRGFNEKMDKGDKLLLGVDLKKHPRIIQKAYDDPHGITGRFNLNLLARMNRELGANFQLDQFEFYANYTPSNGEVNSYIISLRDQNVQIGDSGVFHFDRYELIHTELSKKYSLEEIEMLAKEEHFEVQHHFMDCMHHFVDSLWVKSL